MLVGGCCCNAPDYWIYSSVAFGLAIYRTNPNTGLATAWAPEFNVQCISCDPNTGYVYILQYISSEEYYIRCLTSTGVRVWSVHKTTSPSTGVGQLAVSDDGYVYVTWGGFNELRKYQASDGVEITTGNWPYIPTSPTGIKFAPVACDKSGNIYVGGNSQAADIYSVKVTKLTSAGVVLWTSDASNYTPRINDFGEVRSIAVSSDNTEIMVARLNPGFANNNSHARLSSGGGLIVGWPGYSGARGIGFTSSVAYSTAGAYYNIQQDNTGTKQVFSAGVNLYTLTASDDMSAATAIVVGRDGKIFVLGSGATTPFGYARIKNITDDWETHPMTGSPVTNNPSTMATSDGLIGAF